MSGCFYCSVQATSGKKQGLWLPSLETRLGRIEGSAKSIVTFSSGCSTAVRALSYLTEGLGFKSH